MTQEWFVPVERTPKEVRKKLERRTRQPHVRREWDVWPFYPTVGIVCGCVTDSADELWRNRKLRDERIRELMADLGYTDFKPVMRVPSIRGLVGRHSKDYYKRSDVVIPRILGYFKLLAIKKGYENLGDYMRRAKPSEIAEDLNEYRRTAFKDRCPSILCFAYGRHGGPVNNVLWRGKSSVPMLEDETEEEYSIGRDELVRFKWLVTELKKKR